jgi:putative YphP/YqiW family bacilliredoxin
MYPEHVITPMKNELVSSGFKDLSTPEAVEEFMNKKGIAFLVINSVCGCAAGAARPGARMALQKANKLPENLGTVFAGFDIEATKKAREYMLPYPPSSPSMAVFRDGELIHFLERHHIEGRNAEMIGNHLAEVFEEFCKEEA